MLAAVLLNVLFHRPQVLIHPRARRARLLPIFFDFSSLGLQQRRNLGSLCVDSASWPFDPGNSELATDAMRTIDATRFSALDVARLAPRLLLLSRP
jgi:hypothetical protein